MKVSELMEILKVMPKDAEIVIDNQNVCGITFREGKTKETYGGFAFRDVKPEKAKVNAVSFTRLIENSLGEWEENTL